MDGGEPRLVAHMWLQPSDSTRPPVGPSTLIDYLEGRAIEVDAIFAEPAGHARALGVPTPRMDMLDSVAHRRRAPAGPRSGSHIRRDSTAISPYRRPCAGATLNTNRVEPNRRPLHSDHHQ